MTEIKEKVLIVDDNEDNLRVLSNFLKENGYIFALAMNGASALEILKRDHFDLILLDIMMPNMDGYETCTQIKKLEAHKDTPVIFISALNDTESIVNGFEVGGVDYITKPFNKQEVLVRIKNHLRLISARKEIERVNSELNHNITALTEVHEALDKKNRDIHSSINYASNIISAVLPDKTRLRELLKDAFTLFRPKDVVGGDFYWMKQVGDSVYVCLGDCTGHGVPGAFLSLLAITSLNDLVIDLDDLSPANMVKELGVKFKKSFESVSLEKQYYDLDLGICEISLTNKTLRYSGVQFPLFLCRNNEIELIRSNKYSLSHNTKKGLPVISNEIQLETDDVLYLSSDGFPDQPGGEKHAKIGRKRLKELMLQYHNDEPDAQEEAFLKFFDNWKGDKKQIDDISMLCFKIPEEYSEVEFF